MSPTYTLYHDTGSNTHTDDPKVVIAHAKTTGHRLTTPGTPGIKRLPRLTLPNLKDQPAETVYQELEKSIAKSNRTSDPGEYDKVLGKADEDGYWMATTDGHRALIRAGDDTERERFPAKTAHLFTPGPVRFVLHRPFAQVWRRVGILAIGCIDLELARDTLTLSTRDAQGDTATEAYPLDTAAVISGEPIRFSLNPAYLAPLLRCWPITVACRPSVEGKTTDAPLVFSPAGADWRYIVLPMSA